MGPAWWNGVRWKGSRDDELTPDRTKLLRPVPPERWPFGPPSTHEACCLLHTGGLYCDCKASDNDSDEDWGASY